MLKKQPKLDLEELRSLLKIDRSNLDEEVERQPQYFYTVAEAEANAKSRYDAAKDEEARLFAGLDGAFRKKALDAKETITETAVKKRIERNPKYREACLHILKCKREADELAALREAFKMRSYMLRDLVELHVSGYYESASMRGHEEHTQNRRAEKNQQRMAEKRRHEQGD